MNRTAIPAFLFSFVVLAFLWITVRDPFFWDAIQLGSKHAHFFYENNLRWALLPESIDSGHPPVFGYYLACVWTLLGRNLAASHMALWPFVLGSVILVVRMGPQIAGPRWGYWLAPLFLLDPVVAGQFAGLGPDVALVFFFLLSVFGILRQSPALLLAGVLGLCAVGMRGMMTAAALALWQLLLIVLGSPPFRLYAMARRFLPFLPGFAFAAWFLFWHHQQAGWIGHHPGSPWSTTFEMVGPAGGLRNLLILGWRWVDLGRWAEWAVLGAIWWKQPRLFQAAKPWVLLLVCTAVFLSPTAILYQNISAHRYFLPAFVSLHFLTFSVCARALAHACLQNKIILASLCASLAFGNRWVYPHGVSMTWDSTLAHLPYHPLRADMIDFLDRQGIPLEAVGTAFPNINTGENIALNGDSRSFAEINPETNQYILISNVFNDVSREDRRRWQSDWQLLRRTEHAGVWMELYKSKP